MRAAFKAKLPRRQACLRLPQKKRTWPPHAPTPLRLSVAHTHIDAYICTLLDNVCAMATHASMPLRTHAYRCIHPHACRQRVRYGQTWAMGKGALGRGGCSNGGLQPPSTYVRQGHRYASIRPISIRTLGKGFHRQLSHSTGTRQAKRLRKILEQGRGSGVVLG